MIGIFVWVSTIIIGILSVAWSKSSFFDLLLKCVLLTLTGLGIFILYQENGFSGIIMK